MSVKEFFAFASIKIAAVEFIKLKGDFSQLQTKYKKPFRAHINKHHSLGANQPANEENAANYNDYFVSDGFNSIRCQFTDRCKQSFADSYPSSLKIFNAVNMLVCVQRFSFVVKGREVIMEIDELRVISFDRFQMKLPSSIQYDDYVRVHLDFFKHFNDKIALCNQQFELPNVSKIHTFVMPLMPATEYHLQTREPAFYPRTLGKRIVIQDAKSESSAEPALNKRDLKWLRKVVESGTKHEGFLSICHSQSDLIMDLQYSQVTSESKRNHLLSGSEFDDLDAQIEQIISEGDLISEKGMTPTQPLLLSQHAEALSRQVPCEPLPQVSIAEYLEIESNKEPAIVDERLSNSNSPIENENIRRSLEQQADAGKIEIPVHLTDEQKLQQDSLSFGTKISKGIGYGQNSFKNQAELIEMKRLQGQQGVQRMPLNSQVDLLDQLCTPSEPSQQQSSAKKAAKQSKLPFFVKTPNPEQNDAGRK